MQTLTVSQIAERVGTTPDTVRYYDRLGLFADVARSDAGYRLFGESDVRRLEFIRSAQRFGLRLEEIGELLEVRDRGLCPCGHAREALTARLAEIEQEMDALRRLRDDIRTLVEEEPTGDGCWPCGDQLLEIGTRRTT